MYRVAMPRGLWDCGFVGLGNKRVGVSYLA